MKVLHIGKYYHPFHGGIETVVQSLAEGMLAAGDDVTVLCSATQSRAAHDVVGGVNVLRSPCFGKLFSQPLTPKLPLQIRSEVVKYDVINLHSPNPLAEVALLGLDTRRLPLIVTYHSDIVRQKLLAPFYAPFQRALLRKADAIVVPTENHVRYSPVLRSFERKCRIVPFGLEQYRYELTEESRAKAEALRREHGPYALFVGRQVEYKGLRYLIDSMREVDGRLLLVGDGPLRGELEAQVQALGLGDKVRFIGEVKNQSDLNAYFKACELFVLPSVTAAEAFGMVLLEAMAFGKPLISTRIPSGVRLVNEDGVTGIQVDPRDPRQLAAAMNDLFRDEHKRKAMGEAAYRRFLGRYTSTKMVGAYRELYLSALSRSS